MYTIKTDLHVHTLKSMHAHSTLWENAMHAARAGLEAIAITEHAPAVCDGPALIYFNCIDLLPRQIEGVTIFRGVEANIIDRQGRLDIPEDILQKLDLVIASLHALSKNPESKSVHTDIWLSIAKNPYVDIIGHCGDENYSFDYEAGVKAFAENGKIVEINNHSFRARRGSEKNCREIALLCKKYGCRIAVNSDAHFHESIGRFDTSLAILREIDFPEELIMNKTKSEVCEYIQKRRGIDIT